MQNGELEFIGRALPACGAAATLPRASSLGKPWYQPSALACYCYSCIRAGVVLPVQQLVFVCENALRIGGFWGELAPALLPACIRDREIGVIDDV